MSKHLTPIDIRSLPDLVKIVEEVKTTRKPRILKVQGETLVKITPVTRETKPRKKTTKAAYEAFLSAIGSWKDVDADALIANIYRWRTEGSRPATRP